MIEKAGLSPAEFEAPREVNRESIIRHIPSTSYFALGQKDALNDRHWHWYNIGGEPPLSGYMGDSYRDTFEAWLEGIKRYEKTPDFWAELEGKNVLSSVILQGIQRTHHLPKQRRLQS
jgi:hypothetical protein